MEKRNYVKPILNSEAFVPQAYVAACTIPDPNTIYGWAFRDVTPTTDLGESTSPSGYVIPSPNDVQYLTDLLVYEGGVYTGVKTQYTPTYGHLDTDNDGIVEAGEYLTFTSSTGTTYKATINGSGSDIANPSASTLKIIQNEKNHS